MARINTNIPSVFARSNLTRTNDQLELRLERLSTGLRINRGRDDPAGLIISERLQTDINGVEQAVKNGERASAVIATAEAALSEVSDLLNTIKALMVESANTGANSSEERQANQLQIDSAIDSITRISNSATFGGLKLLDGSLDYITSGVVSSAISKASVFAASFIGADAINVDVDVLASAQKGMLFLSGDNATGTDGVLQSAMTIQIQGALGVREVQFASGASLTDVVAAVNQLSELTGVEAELINNNATSGVTFRSNSYGGNEFVSIQRVNVPAGEQNLSLFRIADDADFPDTTGGFPWGNMALLEAARRDNGRNVQALVNGNLASGEGLKISTSSPTLSVELLIDEAFAIDPTLSATSFAITGGGALFQLGPDINALQQTNIGIQSVAASQLGGTLVDGSLQFLSSLKQGQDNSIENRISANDFTPAENILQTAIDEISILRGRLGAFERNVLDTNQRSLQAAFENLTASRSVIRDADFALETSELTRAQVLQSSGTTVLALANQQAQSVLQLLG